MDQETRTAGSESDSSISHRGFGWRRLQVVAAIGAVASFVAPMVLNLSLEPFLLDSTRDLIRPDR